MERSTSGSLPNRPNEALVDPRNAGSEEYKQTMEEIISEGICPLCPPFKWHPNPILRDDGRWLITENSHPYENTSHHLLIISKRHIELLSQLSTPDLESILNLTRWATQEFNISGAGLMMRFGDTLYTGATIKHLHAHLIVPRVEGNIPQPVHFPIG